MKILFKNKIYRFVVTILVFSVSCGYSDKGIKKEDTVINKKPESHRDYFQSLEESRKTAWHYVKNEGFVPNFEYDNKIRLGPVSEQEQKAGAVPFVRNYMVPMFPESIPRERERVTEISIRVTPGEYEPVSFGIFALRKLDSVAAEASHWQGGESAGDFTICRVECAPVRHGGSSRTKKWQVQPVRLWPLENGQSFDVEANRAFQFWGTLKVKENAEVGKYVLPVKVSSGEGEIYTLKIRVEVLPFSLPATKAAFGVYEGNHISLAEMKDLVAHGCNSMSMWQRWPEYDRATGKMKMDKLDAYLRALKKNGLGHSFINYVGTKSHHTFLIKEAIGEEGIKAYVKDIDRGLAEGVYPENYCFTIDEAVVCCKESSRGDMSPEGVVGNRWDDFVWLMNLVKSEAPHMKRFGVSLNRHQDALLHEGLIDILSCNGDFPESGKWCAETDKKMYTYSSFNKCTYPGQSRFNTGFWPWAAGSHGTFCWAYKWKGGDPFNDFDAGHMDWNLVFPGPGGTLISSPAWEAWREGVDDRRLLELYESLVDKGKADPALLESLRNSMRPDAVLEEKVVGDSDFGALVKNYDRMSIARESLIDGILEAL